VEAIHHYAGSNCSITGGAAVIDELREQLADAQHAIWSHWMRYMFTCGSLNPDGTWTMPADKVERWQRQMQTPYSGLTDTERRSDRNQANKILSVLPPVPVDDIRKVWSAAPENAATQSAIMRVGDWLRTSAVAAVPVDISELHRLRRDVDDICQALDPNEIGGAVNWADLGAREVARVFDCDGNTWLRVVIEEAAPGEERLIVPVRDALKVRGWDIDHIEVATEW
jgi:hypothetical protein